MLVSQLTDDQKSHLAYRLDHNTSCGYGTACRVAKGEEEDLEVVEIFQKYGDRSKRSAQALAKKVETFSVNPEKKRASQLQLELFKTCLVTVHQANFDTLVAADLFENLSKSFKDAAKTYRIIG